MPSIQSAYQTSPCKDYVLSKLKNQLMDALVSFNLIEVRDRIYVVPPEKYQAATATIPVFNYPMVLEHKNENVVVFDARTLLNMENGGNLRPVRLDEFQAKLILGQLALEWADGDTERIFNFNQMPLAIYSGWLGEVIAKRFSIDPSAQLKVSILAAIFYMNQFQDKPVTDSAGAADMLVTITRACGWKGGDAEPILKAYQHIGSLDEFCQICRDYTQDLHLRDLNPLTLQGTVGGYWYGNAGRESIAVALEYPPLWLALVFQSLTDRSFKKAALTDITNRNTYRRHHENFIRGLLGRSEYTGDYRIKVY